MIEITANNKRRLILILSLLLILFPAAFFISRSLWNDDVAKPEISVSGLLPVLTSTPIHSSKTPYEPTTIESTHEEITAAQALPEDEKNPLFLFSMRDENFIHLFSFDLISSQIKRLTNDPWDDIDPAISPDGSKLAFSSNRSGYWDIYILDLQTAEVMQLTNSKAYEASPSWSPDSQWITFESYDEDNLEIQIISTQGQNESPITLTNNEYADHSPVWSPEGRTILFVSDRSGDSEIWAAYLDATENRFVNISAMPNSQDADPVWSPDGDKIAWSSRKEGISKLILLDIDSGDINELAIGKSPLFVADTSYIVAQVYYPNDPAIVCYDSGTGQHIIPPTSMLGKLFGFSNGPHDLISTYLDSLPQEIADYAPATLFENPQNSNAAPSNAYQVIALDNIRVNFPYLHEAVEEPFSKLKDQVEKEIGWNFLDQLDGAYYPLTEPPPPDEAESWLYTGRAIAVNSMPLFGGWMSVVREDFAGQTYWRIYLKTRFQDGSQGRPIKNAVWDFSARYSGNPNSYEMGGSYAPAPEGYWVDFTELALRYGWKRLPALINWRTYFSGTLFNQFVFMENLDWYSAMTQLYPPEALATATHIPTKTLTPTVTPIPTSTPKPTNTITATSTQQATPSRSP